jgi:hypothetical protein
MVKIMSKENIEWKQKVVKKILEKNAIYQKRIEKGNQDRTPYVGGSLIIPENNIGIYFEAKKPFFIFPEKGINMNYDGDIRRYNLPRHIKSHAATEQEIEQFLNNISDISFTQIKEYFFPK